MIGQTTNRAPIHPGEILLEEFLKPLELTQSDLAETLGISFQRLNGIINGHRAVKPDTAMRLARFFGTSAELWLGIQQDYDLWQAQQSTGSLSAITPYPRTSKGVLAAGKGRSRKAKR